MEIRGWFLFLGWIGLAIYAAATNDEQPWDKYFVVTCFLLALKEIKGGKDG